MEISEILTKRLVLKKPSPVDAKALYLELNNREVAKWITRLPEPYTLSEAESWVDVISHMKLNFNIFLHDVLIGGAGLVATAEGHHELGFWLGESSWRKGYATEAVHALLQHASTHHEGKKVVAGCLRDNVRSLKILQGFGFDIQGEDEIFCHPQGKTLPRLRLSLTL
ncbi:MAG: RimJ/RimL family protein N-acetyltransferase [Pseudohongiellaceae bacterium]